MIRLIPQKFSPDLAAAINRVALDPDLREKFGYKRTPPGGRPFQLDWQLPARTMDLYRSTLKQSILEEYYAAIH